MTTEDEPIAELAADEPEPTEWVVMKRAGGPTVGLADDDAPSAPAPDLTAELDAMRHRAELAELERDQLRERVDDMRTAMRMLEAGPARSPEPRRRWWQRKPIVAGASLTVGAAEAAEKVGWVMEHMPMPPMSTQAADDSEPL